MQLTKLFGSLVIAEVRPQIWGVGVRTHAHTPNLDTFTEKPKETIVCEPLTNRGFAGNLEKSINYLLTFDRAGKPSGARVLCLASSAAGKE